MPYVQACITNVSFPQDLPGLQQMLRKNRYFGTALTDLDLLIDFPNAPKAWTAFRWLTSGDLLFFYHAASAPQRIKRIQRKLQREGNRDPILIKVLERAAERANDRAGRIFAVAEISGTPAYERLDDDERHFQGRIFAPFARVDHLTPGMTLDQLAAIGISISRQSALTSIEGEQFTHLKAFLQQSGSIPAYLANAFPGGTGFRDVDVATWRAISCAPEQRFIHEGQVRSYLIDYLLDAVKDPRTPRLEECDCRRGGMSTGRADYFITLAGRWVPVEAKLNLQAERDLPAQLAQYTHIDAFTPTRGARRGTPIPTTPSDVCLVIDQAGLYTTRNGRFSGCSADAPLIARRALPDLSNTAVRQRVLEAF